MGRPAPDPAEPAQPASSVRRLTPTECERLQGWPDGHTIVANWNGKGNPPVEPRYHRALSAAADGLAGRLDGVGPAKIADGGPGDTVPVIVATLNSGGNSGGFRTEPGEHLVYRKATKAHNSDDWERWEPADMSDTLDAEAMGAVQATAILGSRPADDPLLPLGLDSHRYRCCGNGVVAPVAEWIGRRLLAVIRDSDAGFGEAG